MGCVQTAATAPPEAPIDTNVTNQLSITHTTDRDEETKTEIIVGEFLDIITTQSQSGDAELARKKDVWKNLDFFVLDNSIRETTVAQISSHTLSDKQKIFSELKKCGFTDIIVASFSSATRVDDAFVQWLQQTHAKDFSKFYSFSEVTVGIEYDENGNSLYRYNTGDSPDDLPDGLKKNQLYGLKNTVFEADFGNTDDVKWGETWTIDDMCKLIEKRIRFAKDNICKDGRNFLNMRDLSRVMKTDPKRMFTIIKYMAQMPKEYRLFGMIFEEPGGECMPEQVASWCKAVRDTMNHYGWKDGLLLNHIHAKMGYKDVITMDCLANGCNGIWAAVCEEGAAVGHCSSSVTMLNLIRHGNTKVIDKYNCSYLRQAAIQVTKLTTKTPPHPKQIVYGERATDLVFGGGGMGGGGFDLAKFFGMEIEPRISTLATPEMIVTRLKKLFGDNDKFTKEIAIKMKAEMIKDLSLDIKSEYHSPYGIALLFERVGGKPTQEMLNKLNEHKSNFEIHNKIRNEIHNEWNKYTIKNIKKNHGTGSTAVLASIKRKTRRNLLILQKSTSVNVVAAAGHGLPMSQPSQPSQISQQSQSIFSTSQQQQENEEEQAGLLTPKERNNYKNNNFNEFESKDDQDVENISGINDNDDDEKKVGAGGVKSADFLTFDRFYHGFMQPYFGCYRCQITKSALKTLDIDNSGTIEWHEFCAYIDWTLNQYNDEIVGSATSATNINEMAQICLKLTFEKGIIPAMRDRINENSNPFAGPNFRVIQPKNFVKHTATVIFLHGIFGNLENKKPGPGPGVWWFNQFSLTNVQKIYPHIRFVFPTSGKIGITDLNDTVLTAWFDVNHKTNTKDGFKSISGLYNSVEKIKALIRQEMKAYNIKSDRIAICGFDQGALLALLASLSMYEKFAAIYCVNGFIPGNDKNEYSETVYVDPDNEIQKELPIYWFETPSAGMLYDNLGDQFSKKCFDYLKNDCGLNAFYEKVNFKPHIMRTESEPSKFQIELAQLVGKHLPPNDENSK